LASGAWVPPSPPAGRTPVVAVGVVDGGCVVIVTALVSACSGTDVLVGAVTPGPVCTTVAERSSSSPHPAATDPAVASATAASAAAARG
jgi:hypothetical protein